MRVILNAQDVCWEQLRGIQYYTLNLYKALFKRNRNDYALVYCDKDGLRNNKRYVDKHFGSFNIPVHECRELHYLHSIMNDVYRNKPFLDYFGLDADVVHFPHCHGTPNNAGAQLVVTIHDLFPIIYNKFYSQLHVSEFLICLLRALSENAIFIVDSEYTKSELCYYTPVKPERVIAVPLGYNEDECYPQHDNAVLSKFAINQPYFLYFGAVDERKNIRRLLDAHSRVSEKYPGCPIVIAGGNEADFKDLTECVQNAQKSGKVICTDYVSNAERRALMSGAVAFTFPSLAEGFGLPVLEAMACGVPVITSNTSSLPEVTGDAAILIDPVDVDQLAYEMERVLTSDTLRNELIAKGFENCKRFSWDKTAEMTERVYAESICNSSCL